MNPISNTQKRSSAPHETRKSTLFRQKSFTHYDKVVRHKSPLSRSLAKIDDIEIIPSNITIDTPRKLEIKQDHDKTFFSKLFHFKPNLKKTVSKAIEEYESLTYSFKKNFDTLFPISQIKHEDVRDSFRFFFTYSAAETTPFFYLNNSPFPILKECNSQEKFHCWLLSALNKSLSLLSTLNYEEQAKLLCNGPGGSDFCTLIPCYPILQSLSFNAFSTATFHLRKQFPSLFENRVGQLNIKSFPDDPTRYSINVNSKTHKYEATQIKLFRFLIVGETPEKNEYLGHIEVHWTIYGVLGDTTKQAQLHYRQLNFEKFVKSKTKYQILEKLGFLNL